MVFPIAASSPLLARKCRFQYWFAFAYGAAWSAMLLPAMLATRYLTRNSDMVDIHPVVGGMILLLMGLHGFPFMGCMDSPSSPYMRWSVLRRSTSP